MPTQTNEDSSSYSLPTAQVYHDLRFTVIITQESQHDLLNSVHTQPVTAVDEWVSPDEFGGYGGVEVGLGGKVEVGDATFGYDAAVVCLGGC